MTIEDARRITRQAEQDYSELLKKVGENALQELEKMITRAAERRRKDLSFTSGQITFSDDAILYALNSLKANGFKVEWKTNERKEGYFYSISWE